MIIRPCLHVLVHPVGPDLGQASKGRAHVNLASSPQQLIPAGRVALHNCRRHRLLLLQLLQLLLLLLLLVRAGEGRLRGERRRGHAAGRQGTRAGRRTRQAVAVVANAPAGNGDQAWQDVDVGPAAQAQLS